VDRCALWVGLLRSQNRLADSLRAFIRVGPRHCDGAGRVNFGGGSATGIQRSSLPIVQVLWPLQLEHMLRRFSGGVAGAAGRIPEKTRAALAIMYFRLNLVGTATVDQPHNGDRSHDHHETTV
jgi:hypothetical protein